MDKAKLEQYITENMKSVFGYALTRLGNTHEAEELASDVVFIQSKAMSHFVSNNALFIGIRLI